MVRIGTWRKIRQVGSDLYEYENNSGISIKVAHAPQQNVGEKTIQNGRNDWAASLLGGRRYQREYLAGAGTGKISKSKAFKIARAYMLLHPGVKKGKPKKKHQRGRK